MVAPIDPTRGNIKKLKKFKTIFAQKLKKSKLLQIGWKGNKIGWKLLMDFYGTPKRVGQIKNNKI